MKVKLPYGVISIEVCFGPYSKSKSEKGIWICSCCGFEEREEQFLASSEPHGHLDESESERFKPKD